jgi:predicted nucleic acid-binding protein
MNLFIDAQIWLSIYDFSSDNHEQFSKLYDLIDTDISIYMPEQTLDEVRRNRENKINTALSQFRKINIQIPNLCKGYDEYKSYQEMVSHLEIMHRDFLKKIEEDIMKRNLIADRTLEHIFSKIRILPRLDGIIQKAYWRFSIGNPPGKDKSYGDAINWETLIENIPSNEDLFFISSDKDYKSVLDDNRFNQYLLDEWKTKKNSNLFYYKSLTEYFKSHLKDIELKTDTQKNTLISQLGYCGSFAATHSTISKLSYFSSWTDEQIEQLLQAANNNNQVWAIINDLDIKSFFDNVLKDKVDNFSPKEEFKWILNRLGYLE